MTASGAPAQRSELQLYPGIRKHVRHWNRIVYFWSGLMLLMEIVNLILSLIALVQATHMGAGNACVPTTMRRRDEARPC